ncbi:MAG TPA: HEAT repeat domain-containing protein [Nitrospiraceae bacterium]|nr:HEAT repeat domain-containing protein [Nitrospiraceae bacterium]
MGLSLRASVDAVSDATYHAGGMTDRKPSNTASLTSILLLIGLVVTCVWVWKRIPPETQDYLVERMVPLALLALGTGLFLLVIVRKVLRRWKVRQERDRLIASFERETLPGKRLDLAFALVELNGYRLEGLERVAPGLRDLFIATLKTALGDKQHRIRGMAASYLGVLQDKAVVPLLLTALEDDHAYVRASAALALGRMRADEAKSKLTQVMQEDWDQTVRSRAREALERIV